VTFFTTIAFSVNQSCYILSRFFSTRKTITFFRELKKMYLHNRKADRRCWFLAANNIFIILRHFSYIFMRHVSRIMKTHQRSLGCLQARNYVTQNTESNFNYVAKRVLRKRPSLYIFKILCHFQLLLNETNF